MAISSLSPEQLCRHIDAAKRRVAFMAPGTHLEVAQSLCAAWQRLGPNAVNVILDTRAEVFRLGYGSFEALEMLSKTAKEFGAMVCHQEGVQLGVLVADDVIAVFAPKPLMVAASDLDQGEVNCVVFDLENPAERMAEQIGATESPMGRDFGLDPVPASKIEAVREDLDKNPPQKFNVFRKVNVFNAMFEFVEMEVKGSQITRKEVTLPPELSAITSDEVRDKLKTSYRLIDASPELANAQEEVAKLRKAIERTYLRVIPGHGMAVLRSDREGFDNAVKELKGSVEKLQAIVDAELEHAMGVSIDEIARAIIPGLAAGEKSKDFTRWMTVRPNSSIGEFVYLNLKACFDRAAKDVQRMSVSVVFKSVTYESLKEERFVEAARKAFPELEQVFVEFEAARGASVEKEDGTE